MTTAERDRPWRRNAGRVALFSGHYAYWLLFAVLGVSALYNLLARPGWLTWPATILNFTWIAALLAQALYHDHKLCERCAGSAPLDPQAAVDRWRKALRLYHKNLAGLLLGGSACVLIFVHWHPAWLAYTLNIIGLVFIAAFWTGEYQHRRLYPWCPWCHWDDGGDEEFVPGPDPEIEKV